MFNKKNWISEISRCGAILVYAMATLASAQQAGSQDQKPAPDPTRPDFVIDVVYTESKIPQPLKNSTQQIIVIDSKDFDLVTTTNRNIAELLQYQPGVAVTVLSRNDANWGSYGGMGPKYNSFLLDGLPIDSFMDPMSLDPWAFKRIELHQGPASVLYSNYLSMDFAGNQAPLAGITNLILKDHIDKPMMRVLLGGGSWNTFNGRFYAQDHKGRFHYFAGASYEQSDYTNYGTPGSWLNILEDPAYKKTKLYGKATYDLGVNNHYLSFFAQTTFHEGSVGRPNRDYGHNYTTLNAVYNNEVNERLNIQLKAGFRNYDRRWGEDYYPESLRLREHDGMQQGIFPTDLTFNVKHSGESLLTAGADAQYAKYQTYAETTGPRVPGNDATALSTGLFMQEKYVRGNWVLRAGGRLNRTSNTYNLISGAAPGLTGQSWNKFLWSAGVRYNASRRFAVYSNVGSSFIPPSAKSVGGTLNSSDLGVSGRNGQLPNPNLQPESGIGSDFGADFRPVEKSQIGIRVFYNRLNDAIVENAVSANPSQSMSVNAGNARSSGVEIPYQQDLTGRLHLFANFTWTSTNIQNPFDRDQDGSAIPFVPEYVGNAGLNIRLPHSFTVSPYFHAVGTYYDSSSRSGRAAFGPYQVLSLKVEKVLHQTDEHAVVLFADLNNLTNRKYQMPWQFQDPGFNVFGGLEFRLR
jgi:iron complex outermembrane recepter protein